MRAEDGEWFECAGRRQILGDAMKRPPPVVDTLPGRLVSGCPHAAIRIRPVAQAVAPVLALLSPLLRNEHVRVILGPRGLAVK